MGFPIERANAALDSTDSGHDINGAISYLMNEAHAKTRPAQHTSRSDSHYSEHGEQDDIGTMVSDLSTEFMNKASLFFNTGRKKLQEGLDMYKQQQFEKSNNQPAWMKNQERYKANSMHLPGDEDEEQMDPETMRRLVEQQRLKEKKLRVEKERAIKEDLLKRQHEASMLRQQQHQSSVFDAPKPRRRPTSRASSTASSSRQHTPVPSSSGSQHNSPSASATSSPSTTSTRPHVAQPQPTKAKRADEALLDMLNAPIVSKTPPPSRLDRLRNSSVDNEQVYTSSKRRGASNRSRTFTPASSSVKLPQVAISDAQKSRFTSAKTGANDLFKRGDFPRALELFEASLSALPSGHPFQIIAYSNLATVYSKTGNSKLQLESADKGLALVRSISENVKELDTVTIEDDKSVKSFWVKLVSRKAESLEHLEKFQDALAAYNMLIENGSASKPIMDGRRRCNDVLQPKPKPKPKPQQKPRPTRPSTTLQNNETVQRVKEQNRKQESLENEKFQLHDQVEAKLGAWRQGKEDNLRALLSSLQLVLWPELNWKTVGLTDLVLDKKVKITYMKAVAKTHPDKIPGNATTEQKLIANGVFITLNKAWDNFKKMNNL
ncbi:unnamed protein product [Ambrosiozyma monospora]|uniref:Unnamed protein product n=1 Tax=Ambrosiozyma monospora TaxID=43982 RepID=A0A9W6YQR9_AMBMO|nr:unnamed protein product [Ambrosiozyma monospora]